MLESSFGSQNYRLEQLFGSKTRIQLLYLFFNNPEKSYFVRELTRLLNVQINSVRRELINLGAIGIIQTAQETARSRAMMENPGIREKKYFKLNPSFILCAELKNLFLKSQLIVERDYIQKILGSGKIDYFILTGKFTAVDSLVDMLIAGTVGKDRLKEIVKEFEEYLGREVNYTVLDTSDFLYRKSIADKFLHDILNKKKIMVVDNLSDVKTLAINN